MTRTPPPTRAKGVSGLVFLFCATAGGLGLAFDLTRNDLSSWWLGAEPGAAAVIGLGAATLAVLAGHALRFLLRRRGRNETTEERDAGHHA
ncbi:MAG: hypothetical protein R3C16_12750 [Hyphomonadaceae bacterium]